MFCATELVISTFGQYLFIFPYSLNLPPQKIHLLPVFYFLIKYIKSPEATMIDSEDKVQGPINVELDGRTVLSTFIYFVSLGDLQNFIFTVCHNHSQYNVQSVNFFIFSFKIT